MITSLYRANVVQPERKVQPQPAPVASKTIFKKVLQAADTLPQAQAQPRSGLLGLCSPKPAVAQIKAAAQTVAKSETGQASGSASLPASAAFDLFSRDAIESRMNAWLIGYNHNRNDEKMRLYDMALADWKLNNARCMELGITPPAPPQKPELAKIEPMPAGWWFQTNRVDGANNV